MKINLLHKKVMRCGKKNSIKNLTQNQLFSGKLHPHLNVLTQIN